MHHGTFCDFSGLSVTEKDSGKAHFRTRTRNRTQNTNSHQDRGAKEKIAYQPARAHTLASRNKKKPNCLPQKKKMV
jgi:hypothetical protein